MTLPLRHAALAVLLVIPAACTKPDTVVFVTNTSIGIDVGGTPPVAALGYDRIEGYFAPRYDNGAVPPVVASLESGGSVFDPRIRQVYATGSAARLAVDPAATAPGAPALQQMPLMGGKKVMFFGTTTSLGFKVGFSAAGGYPDSVTFGYKRMEASIIPVGSRTCPTPSADPLCPAGQEVDTYASVLASIDTTSSMTDLKDVGLDSRQFFATGIAAEHLAANPLIREAFRTMSQTTALSKASADAATLTTKVNTQNSSVKTAISAADGSLDSAKLAALVSKASPSLSPQTAKALNACKTVDEVMTLLSLSPPASAALSAAASTP